LIVLVSGQLALQHALFIEDARDEDRQAQIMAALPFRGDFTPDPAI
jgi:hypothetical protein